MTDAEDRQGEGIAISRVFDAPREAVWGEWTTQEAFADGTAASRRRSRSGASRWTCAAGGPGRRRCSPARSAGRFAGRARYLEVDEPDRLAFTVTDRPGEEAHEVVTVVLVELGDWRTEMRMTQTGGGEPLEEL